MGGTGEQMEKRFSWVLQKFSSLQDEKCYSRPFSVAGVNWRLLAYPKGDKNDGHLSLYLEFEDPASLPPGWSRDVKFTLALVTKAQGKTSIVLGGQSCFDAKNNTWGYTQFVPLAKLHEKSEGFLVNNKLIILAELHVLPAVVVVLPEETVKITTEPLSCKDGTQADDASVGKSSCEETENSDDDDDDVSEEGSYDDEDSASDDGSFEEDVDSDDVSSSCLDDGGEDMSLLDQSNALEDATDTTGNHGVTLETEVSNDDAPKYEASNDSASNGTSLDQVKSLEDAFQTVENGGTETANNLLQPAKETMDVNGFDVFSFQVESVSHIFRRHPDIASDFRPKNRQIRRAYMNELLSLIETLCQSPEKLSEDDLSNADDTLSDLTDVGFKLNWLKRKLDEVSEKKKKEKGSGARLQTMEEQLQKLKLMFLDLETQLQIEKAEALVVRAPLSFNDVVC